MKQMLTIVFLGCTANSLVLVAQAQPPATPANPPTQPVPAPAEAYSYGDELMKKILLSIRKDKFDFQTNFDITLTPGTDAPAVVNALDMEAHMSFQSQPEGINLPLSAPNSDATEQEKKLALKTRLDLNNRYAVIRLSKGERTGEYVGSMYFYSRNEVKKVTVRDYIKLELNNDLLDFKRIYLYGAKLKVQLPGPTSSKEDLKKGLLNAVLNCEASVDSLDFEQQTFKKESLEKCEFSFDG